MALDGRLLLTLVVVAMGAFAVWGLVDGWFVAPRSARTKFAALAAALGQPVVRDGECSSLVSLTVDGRDIALRRQYVGSGGAAHVRGERGHLWVTATPLRARAWEMHDLQVRQRRREAPDWAARFAVVESGVPVRDGWCTEAVQTAIADFYDHPLAVGTMRVDRGELLHAAYLSKVRGVEDAGLLRDFAARFAALADAFDRAAGRFQPLS